jgi:hypothetical protein
MSTLESGDRRPDGRDPDAPPLTELAEVASLFCLPFLAFNRAPKISRVNEQSSFPAAN